MSLTSTKIGGKNISDILTSTSISACTDSIISNPINDQILTYNGSKWVNTNTNNNLSMDYITYAVLSDYSAGTTTMSNLFSSFIIDISVTSGDTGQDSIYAIYQL